jgi:predicted dehydrogenase
LYSYNEAQKINFDFAIVSNPTAFHQDAIKNLIQFKVPLFIEKPLFHKLEITSVINELEKNEIQSYVACNLRFYDSIGFIKEYIESKRPRINEINVYCGSYLPEWRKDADYRKNYSAKRNFGGGVHLDLIHELDYIYWIFGKPLSIKRTLKNNSSLNIESIDYANYLLEYDNFCVNIILNYFRIDAKRIFEIVFQDETWQVDLLKNTIYSNKGKVFSSNQTMMETYDRQMKYFIENIHTKKIMNTANEAFEVLKICLNNDA